MFDFCKNVGNKTLKIFQIHFQECQLKLLSLHRYYRVSSNCSNLWDQGKLQHNFNHEDMVAYENFINKPLIRFMQDLCWPSMLHTWSSYSELKKTLQAVFLFDNSFQFLTHCIDCKNKTLAILLKSRLKQKVRFHKNINEH